MKHCWTSKLSNTIFLAAALLPLAAAAQFSAPEEKFVNGEKYLYPINPGQPGSLAGTMGELRSTHFHSGIDIRTNNKVGFPVHASKSGYISRVTVTPSGYGNVLYITHPDGNTTLYAHLERFRGAVARHVLEEQYRRQDANVDLYFQPNEFQVKRGDTVAISGNSGSSSGPHLHFDIRDRENFALNPLLVEGFPEIVDNLPPAVEKVALRTLDINSRINDQFGRFEFHVQRVGNDFVFSAPILARGNIGVEILAKDKLAPRSAFYGGVNNIDMEVDGKLVFSQAIDKINIASTRGVYTLMDFKTMRLSGNRFYKLYVDDGNNLPFYTGSPTSGKLTVEGEKESLVVVSLKDAFGNSSKLTFTLKPTPYDREVTLQNLPEEDYDIFENILRITTSLCPGDSNKAIAYAGGRATEVGAAYYNDLQSVFLFDLKKSQPDSITICEKKYVTNFRAVVPAGNEYNYYSDIIDIRFPENALYDTIYLTTFRGMTPDSTEVFNIGSRTNPLNHSLDVTLRPATGYNWDQTHGVYRIAGKGYSYLGGEWQNGGVRFSTREFGDFTVLRDTVPPTIKPIAVNGYLARFKIKDNLSGINEFTANINGQWLLMHYDPKLSVIWSELLDKTKPLKGNFTLVVTDNAGNQTKFTRQIP